MSANGRLGGATPLRAVPRQRFGRLTLRDLPLPAGKFGASWVHERLPRRSRTPAIYHQKTEEAFFVLSGHAEVFLNGRRSLVRAGDTLHIPAGVVHRLSTGSSGVEALSLFSPPMDPKNPDVRLDGAPGPAGRSKKSAPKRN